MGNSNPLLQIQFQIPFDQIRAEHVEPAIAELIRRSKQNIDRIAAATAPRTWANTMQALDQATEELDYAMSVVRHIEAVATHPALRAAYNAVQPVASAFYSSIPLDEALYSAIKEYADTEDARALTGVRARCLKKTLDSFRRHGAELDPAGKKKLGEIDVELAKLTTAYGEHVLDATNAWELLIEDEKGLAGLPPSAIAAARQSAEEKGRAGWRFTLQAPSYVAVMTYLDDSAVRERIYRAYTMRAAAGEHDNRELVVRILELRQAKARLLGYRDFSDLVLEDRMARRGASAWEFLDDLRSKTQAHFTRENAELLAFRRSVEGPDAPELQAWDTGYWAEKQRAALYEFDEEDLRPYFPVHNVVQGMFALAQKLFGIDVVEKQGVPVWHPDVKYYEIVDEEGAALGSFYADWFPRETKRGGAWMDAFLTGQPGDQGFTPHLGLICGNLTPPLGADPALLTHSEVETIFHEFGHLLHHCLSRVEVRGMAGTNVAWDFVELPSQIMENWCWERASLALFARHYKSGEPIPEDLFAKMTRARTFRSANAQMRQLGFGVVDMALHREYSAERDGEVVQYTRNLTQAFSAAPLPREHSMITSFTHLFSSPVGYGAGYYSYKWAEVLDADAFSRFQQEGVFNRKTGADFREWILSRGDGEDPAVLFRGFMGRDPDPTSLLRRSGLGG
jgi:oligopeptidase A